MVVTDDDDDDDAALALDNVVDDTNNPRSIAGSDIILAMGLVSRGKVKRRIRGPDDRGRGRGRIPIAHVRVC